MSVGGDLMTVVYPAVDVQDGCVGSLRPDDGDFS